MGCRNKILLFVDILSITLFYVNSAPLSDGNGTNAGDLNGGKLMELGKALKLPILRMIGRTIDSIEKKIGERICNLHPCTEWTEWSACITARDGKLSTKFRTRQCSVNMTTCENEKDTNSKTEKEFGICILDMKCPYGYNFTKNGFCMKLYADTFVTKDAAEQQCQKDGGILVNIDSESKYEDVSSLLKGSFHEMGIWIDGHRKDVNSPWEYTYGSQKGFFKWFPTQPKNNADELCLVVALYSHGLKWHSYTCTGTWYSICEISKTT